LTLKATHTDDQKDKKLLAQSKLEAKDYVCGRAFTVILISLSLLTFVNFFHMEESGVKTRSYCLHEFEGAALPGNTPRTGLWEKAIP